MQRLKGKKQIEELFVSGSSISVFPLRLVYLKTKTENRVGVSVSKKNFKSAVDRNKIKRRLRFGVENHFKNLEKETKERFSFMILYTGKEMPESRSFDAQFETVLNRFKKNINDLKK
jgi:ribonuclease P protein component